MGTKNQHFVPRVYLKSWETRVFSDREPKKPFQGVYQFDKGNTVGNGTTRESILWEPHLYTISFRQLYMAQKCPGVYRYFADEIYKSMKNNCPKPVYAKLGSVYIKNKSNVRRYLYKINEWDFFYYDGTVARKKSLLNRFNDLRCYLLEDLFGSLFESRWDEIKSKRLIMVRMADIS